MNLDLTNQRAIVCGSTQGIGKAVALELASMGASIVLIARNEDTLNSTRQELDSSKNQKHDIISADFSYPEELKVKVQNYIDKHPDVSILVNNTGGPPGGPVAAAKTEEFIKAFSNHLICNHIMAQAVIEAMKKKNYGRIINIISTSVKQPLKGLGVSNTIRAAVANWSKTLSLELAPHGITVNNVLPGATNTVRLSSLITAKAEKTGHSKEYHEEEMVSEIPAGRFAEAHEIAAAVAFLASPAAAYITGINLPVDGGRTGCL
jgi:3-oxoacyl-[acyl-carrier protein] reductase